MNSAWLGLASELVINGRRCAEFESEPNTHLSNASLRIFNFARFFSFSEIILTFVVVINSESSKVYSKKLRVLAPST